MPRSARSKIKSPAQLRRILRSGGGTVFTNGCFDLLHRGHLSYLERARKLGKRLVVALNGDASVRKLKGKGRPVNPLADRLEVLAGLECVDYVTWFNEPTPLKLILKLKPSVLVKGGDWPASAIVGGREVRGWGGKVRSLGFLKGRSTSRTIRKIIQK